MKNLHNLTINQLKSDRDSCQKFIDVLIFELRAKRNELAYLDKLIKAKGVNHENKVNPSINSNNSNVIAVKFGRE